MKCQLFKNDFAFRVSQRVNKKGMSSHWVYKAVLRGENRWDGSLPPISWLVAGGVNFHCGSSPLSDRCNAQTGQFFQAHWPHIR